MEDFISQLVVVFNSLMSCVTTACTTIVGSPFLLFTTGILFAGAVIGIIGRILSRS